MKFNYPEIGTAVGELVAEKQAAYGDSFGKSGELLKILFPKGIPVEMYTDALAIVRIIDKLFRLCTDPGYGGESPWRDICGYSLLRFAECENLTKDSVSVADMEKYCSSAFISKYLEDDCYTDNEDITPDDTPPA
jgi:hypothetical protein